MKGSIADLEALVGHAVVIEDATLFPDWRMPEDFAAAICVPVSSPTNPLGTLWLFGARPREFSPQESNLVEIVAGRIAADLEREMLLSEGVQTKRVKMQWSSAATWQQQRLPKLAPLVEGYQVAGWTLQADGVGGDFYDWNVLENGHLALTIGDAHGAMLQAGLTAAVTQTALRSHSQYLAEADRLLARINESLWSCSAGDEFASLFFGSLDPAHGCLQCSLAGSATALLLSRGETEMLTTEALPLGAVPETVYPLWKRNFHTGDTLVAMSEGVREARDRGGLRIGEGSIATLVRRATHLSAAELSERIRDLVEHHCPKGTGLDRTVLVLKRRR